MRNLLKSISLYAASTVVSMAIPFLLIPVLTAYLSPEDYGKIRLVNVYVMFLIPVVTLCSNSLFSVDYFKRHASRFSSLVTTSLIIPIPLTLVLYGVISLYNSTMYQHFEIDYSIALLIPLIVLFSFLNDYFLAMLIVQKKSTLYAVVTIAKTLLESALSIFLIVMMSGGWHARIFSWVIVLLFMSVYTMVYFYRNGWLVSRPKMVEVKLILIYSLPLVFHQLGKIVINQSDTLFISKLVSLKETGIYSIGYQLGSLVSVFGGLFLNIYTPFLFERMAKPTRKARFQVVYISYMFIIVSLALVVFLTVTASFIFRYVFDARYYDGHLYVFWTALAYFFWCCYLMFSGVIFFFHKTRLLLIISIVNVALNLSLNYILISRYQTMGACYSTLISFFITFLITFVFSRRIYALPWGAFRVITFGHRLLYKRT